MSSQSQRESDTERAEGVQSRPAGLRTLEESRETMERLGWTPEAIQWIVERQTEGSLSGLVGILEAQDRISFDAGMQIGMGAGRMCPVGPGKGLKDENGAWRYHVGAEDQDG
jgi:hypothetical protein